MSRTVCLSHSSPTRTHKRIAKQFLLISQLPIQIWEKIGSFSTSTSGAEEGYSTSVMWEARVCGVSIMHPLYVLFRYDHTRPSAAAGGAVGAVPQAVPSPAFHSLHPTSDLTVSIVKTNLHEPGKREKRTLVLRDRSEWQNSPMTCPGTQSCSSLVPLLAASGQEVPDTAPLSCPGLGAPELSCERASFGHAAFGPCIQPCTQRWAEPLGGPGTT